MSEIASPVPVKDIVVPRGATRELRFYPTRGGLTVDLSIPGVQIIFTARISEDATPALQKSYVSTGTTPHLSPDPGGITATKIDTSTPPDGILDTWVADLTIDPADTEEIEESLLRYDLWLLDSTGESPMLQGTLKLSPTIFRP